MVDANTYPKMLYKMNPAGRHQLQVSLGRVHETGNFEVEIADSEKQELEFMEQGFSASVVEAAEQYKKITDAPTDKAAAEAIKPVGSETKQGQDANAKAKDNDSGSKKQQMNENWRR